LQLLRSGSRERRMTEAHEPYAPLGTLKAVADGLWIVDGPEIGMRALGLTIPFPTRMTVARLPDGTLWLHSPIEWTADLGRSLEALGPIRHLVAPNTLHYWFLPDWSRHYPQARTYGPAALERTARRPVRLDETLSDSPPEAWKASFDQCVVAGRLLTEVDFFHRPSRTLILTDLIENFEPKRVRPQLLRWLVRASGAAAPDGKAPIDMQLGFAGNRKAVRKAVQRMIGWAPDRIVLAHGLCYPANGTAELRRAFRWVL
jgi:hypothetical protein